MKEARCRIVGTLLFLVCILCIGSTSALAAPVVEHEISTFEEFQSEITNSDQLDRINLLNNLTIEGEINNILQYAKIDGHGYSIDGNNLNEGFTFSSSILGERELRISNVGSYEIDDTGNIVINEAIKNFSGSSFSSGNSIFHIYQAELNIDNSVFTNNNGGSYGAIWLRDNSEATISNSLFYQNESYNAPFISNEDAGQLIIKNSLFYDNELGNDYGTAIKTQGIGTVTTILNSEFKNNTAKNWLMSGGAVHVERGTLNVVADGGNTIFSNNTVQDGWNTLPDRKIAITNFKNGPANVSTTNLNAGNGGYIQIDDMLTSISDREVLTTDNTLNINKSAIDLGILGIAPDNGKVILNNTIKGYTINLYNGELVLNQESSTAHTLGTPIIEGAILNLLGGTLNIANNKSDIINLVDYTSNGAANLIYDMGLSGGVSDKFIVTSDITGQSININAVNIIADTEIIGNPITLFERSSGSFSGSPLTITGLPIAYTNSYNYTFTDNGDGTVTPLQTPGANGFLNAFTDASASRSFSATGHVTLAGNMSNMAGTDLYLFGNQYNINGNNNNGVTILAGQTVNVYNVGSLDSNGDVSTSWNGFRSSNNGGVFNSDGTLNIYNSVFSSNGTSGFSYYGGVINNTSGSTLNIFDTTFDGNYTGHKGGAISNLGDTAKTNIINSIFKNNSAGTDGGAIYNEDTNTANNSTDADTAITTISNSTFDGNTAVGDGGAIYNMYGEVKITDSNFTNNNAGTLGGAIVNNDIMTITATSKDVLFSDNTLGSGASQVANDIYNTATGQITFGGVKNITLEGGIDGSGTIYKTGTGTLKLGGDNSNYNGVLRLQGGTVSLLNGGQFLSASDTYLSHGVQLNFMNNQIDTINLGNLHVSNNTIPYISIDADLQNQTGDFITATDFPGSQQNSNVLTINNINLMGTDSTQSTTSINIIDTTAASSSDGTILTQQVGLASSATKVMGSIYQYDVSYDNATGNLNFVGGGSSSGGYNPAVMTGSVGSLVGSYLTQLNAYSSAFSNMDITMLMPKAVRQSMKYRNKTAYSTGVPVFSPTMLPEEEKGLWFRPYTTFESVGLKNGPSVSNVMYGSFFGGDSELISLGNDKEIVYSAYGAYNGSHQAYDGIGIYQNGGLLGATAVLYKNDFFTGLTANVGANVAEASTQYGRDNFNMLTAGIASKTGYNFELAKGKFIIQPSYTMAYTFVNTFDYNTSNGVNITSSPLNAIMISPGVKFIGNLKNNWQPYLSVSMIWNIMDDAKFSANDVALPELSVKPYVAYGVGLQKRWGERFTGFLQTMLTNGGRNGVGLQFGFRWSI